MEGMRKSTVAKAIRPNERKLEIAIEPSAATGHERGAEDEQEVPDRRFP